MKISNIVDYSYNWLPPVDWSSEPPIVYLSLDSDENVQLKNGADIIDGKVCSSNKIVYQKITGKL